MNPSSSSAGLIAESTTPLRSSASSDMAGASSGVVPAMTPPRPSSASRAASGSTPAKSERRASSGPSICAPSTGMSGPAGCMRLRSPKRASHPTARSSVMAIVPSAVTSASGRPGATTVRPLALTHP